MATDGRRAGMLSDLYVGGQTQAKNRIHKALFDANFDLEDVTAKAMELKLDSIERLDRLLASAEARRNTALREIDRHRETLGIGARQAIEEVEDAEYSEVGPGEVQSPLES